MAPLLLLDALDHQTGPEFVIGYLIAILSNIFGGIIAQRLGVSTAQLHQANSRADIFLFLCLAASTWLVFPQVILDCKVPLLIAAAAQLTLFAISLVKFKKLPSFHTYTAEVCGLTLLTATIGLLDFGYSGALKRSP